jgi:MFS family permease
VLQPGFREEAASGEWGGSMSVVSKRLFYGWYIAVAGAGTNCVVLGITQFGFGVFIEAFRVTFGWSVTAIALGYSIRTLEQGIFAPFTGYIADRVGPRRMAVTGVTIIALSLLLFSQATTLPIYYAASVVMALGQSIGGANAFTLAIMRWFVRRRGNAMSVITTGNGFGYFATLALAALLAALGLHDAFLVLGAIVFFVGLPLALVIRDRPEDMGLAPDGDSPVSAKTDAASGKVNVHSASGSGVREALRTPAFYLLVLAMSAGSAAQLVWIVFQVPHLVAQGFSITFVGAQAALYGMIAIPLRWGVGWLGDTFGRARVYMIAVTLEGIGLCFLAFVTPERWWLFIPFYLTFGLGHCGWLVLSNTLAADTFGAKNFATIRGLLNTFSIPVSIVLPLCMGFVFDTQGNYQMAYVGVAVLVVTGALSLSFMKKAG